MYYMQTSSVGSVDGINAMAIDRSGFTNNLKRKLAINTKKCVARFEDNFDMIGFQEKTHGTPSEFNNRRNYNKGNIVKRKIGAVDYRYVFNSDYDWRDDDKDLNAFLSALPNTGPVSKLTASANQLLIDDQLVGYIPWSDRKYFNVGDVVREQITDSSAKEGGRLFVRKKQDPYFDTTAKKPGGSGNWQSFWAEHWRTADGLYVDSVAKLAQIFVAGPTPTKELSSILGASGRTNVSELMLPISGNSMSSDTKSIWNIPHAAALMDRYTIHSPNADGANVVDNDANRDNAKELLVPGLVNINTASTHLLNKILPVTDIDLRNNIVQDIVSYRKIIKGITNPYQLSGVIRRMIDSGDNAMVPSNGYVVDFNNPDMLTADGIANDREEEMMPSKWLAGVASTRSDIFTAYIQVRGYPARDFRKGAVESKQLIVVFDRSNIINGENAPKILAIYEY